MINDWNDLDLVEQMQWEDSEDIEFISLQEAGLENEDYDTVPYSLRTNYYLLEDPHDY